MKCANATLAYLATNMSNGVNSSGVKIWGGAATGMSQGRVDDERTHAGKFPGLVHTSQFKWLLLVCTSMHKSGDELKV